MENIFYVYIYLDPRKPGKYCYDDYCFLFEPFYVGVASQKQRMYDHLRPCKQNKDPNKIKVNKINKIIHSGYNLKNGYIFKIHDCKYREIAIEHEINMIKAIGRSDINLGPLTNRTNGGDGGWGYIPSEAQKRNLSKMRMGDKNPFFGKHHSQESIDISVESRKNYKTTDETKKKLSDSISKSWKDPKRMENQISALSGPNNPMYGKLGKDHKSSKPCKITSPYGESFIADSITCFVRQHPHLNVSKWKLGKSARKKIKVSGWSCEYIKPAT